MLRLEIATPQEFDPDFFEVYQYVFTHHEPTVRSVGFQAWQYCAWQEIIPIVEKMKTSDPNEQIRAEAEDMLKAYEVGLTYEEQDRQQAKTIKQEKFESNEFKESIQSQQKLDRDRKQFKNLQSQLKKVEERIENARRTNIFGRPQSGENERERDRLVWEIKKIKHRIALDESAIKALEE